MPSGNYRGSSLGKSWIYGYSDSSDSYLRDNTTQLATTAFVAGAVAAGTGAITSVFGRVA